MTSSNIPVACSLTTADAAKQTLEWADLRRHATAVSAVGAGATMTFPAKLEADVADLVRREAACCAFLDIKTDRVGDSIAVTISSTNPDAAPIIALFAGTSTPQ